ncbi:hypothetical protein FB566_3278 [Stackebrandtia endophytica]|uniref:Uncharacterized protein n=1 Tax=Stackebrandtia endophytica TaxID=1496996 RepID=A0A543AYR5_9ACTN|nr:hypothetical protein [Stackebrandtia endophytica]TQL77715.1 hypothetical protein FB566_3278 [Stackebrandtia endophytica]
MAGGSSVGALLASPDVQVGGVEPEEVIESMDEALRNVHLAVSDEERILAKSLNDDLTLVTWPDLVLDVPVINDDPTAHLGEFRLPSVVDG